MSVLVNQQQETIETIETQAATVEHDTEAGYVIMLMILTTM
jgi:t-SNARE complex subunit (syntaxin)